MAMYSGTVHGGHVILRDCEPLPDGTEVVVTPVADLVGSPARLLAALDLSAPITDNEAFDLRTAIDTGRTPLRFESPLTIR